MKQEFSAKALRSLRDDLDAQHRSVLADLENRQNRQDHTVHNVLQAHTCYRAVIDRVMVDVEGMRPCNPTDLELLDIRKVYYSRQVADYYRNHPKI